MCDIPSWNMITIAIFIFTRIIFKQSAIIVREISNKERFKSGLAPLKSITI